jgi:hypothetical protein
MVDGALHANQTGANVHVAGYVQSGDPGAVGAGKQWVDTTGGAGAWVVKTRNAANDGWETTAATPTMHATTHQSGGGDAIKLDDLAAPDDTTDLDVSITAHGLAPKAPNDADQYLDGTGAWSVPAGGGGGATDFLDLGDTPGAYPNEGAILCVNGAVDALDFSTNVWLLNSGLQDSSSTDWRFQLAGGVLQLRRADDEDYVIIDGSAGTAAKLFLYTEEGDPSIMMNDGGPGYFDIYHSGGSDVFLQVVSSRFAIKSQAGDGIFQVDSEATVEDNSQIIAWYVGLKGGVQSYGDPDSNGDAWWTGHTGQTTMDGVTLTILNGLIVGVT